MENMSWDQIKFMNKELQKHFRKATDAKLDEMVNQRISAKMLKWEKTKKADEIRSEFDWIAEPYIEKFAAEKELLSGCQYEIYATEKEEVAQFRLMWNGCSYKYLQHRWLDKQGNVYVNEIQNLLDNLFEENYSAMSERVENAALDLVVAQCNKKEEYFLVLDDFYKNENKNLCKKVHDENIEKIIRKVLEI